MCQRCSEVFGCRLEMFGGLWRCSWLFHPPIAEAAVPPPYRRQGPEEATGILQACTVACGQEPSMEVAWHKGPTHTHTQTHYPPPPRLPRTSGEGGVNDRSFR